MYLVLSLVNDDSSDKEITSYSRDSDNKKGKSTIYE